MSIETFKWLLCAVIIALGLPLGLLTGDLVWPKFAGVAVIVMLIVFLSYLMGAL